MKSILIETKNISLSVVDTSRSSILLKSRKFKSYLLAAISSFEDFTLNKAGLFLKSHGVKSIELSLTLCGKQKIRKLNTEFRNKEKVTDVLSFPVHENLRELDYPLPFNPLEIGDIIICKDIALKQSKEFSISYEELIHLLVHGFLHLVGYDHEISKEEEVIMQDLEKKLLKKITKLRK